MIYFGLCFAVGLIAWAASWTPWNHGCYDRAAKSWAWNNTTRTPEYQLGKTTMSVVKTFAITMRTLTMLTVTTWERRMMTGPWTVGTRGFHARRLNRSITATIPVHPERTRCKIQSHFLNLNHCELSLQLLKDIVLQLLFFCLVARRFSPSSHPRFVRFSIGDTE